MLRKITMWFLAAILIVGVAAIYGGIAWGIAWLLETIFSLAVNYTIFVSIGLGLFVLTVIPYILFVMIAKKQTDEINKEFARFNRSFREW